MSTDALARRLYEACPTPKPSWEQLGDITRAVWRDSAERHAAGDPEWWSCQPRAVRGAMPTQQQELFA